LRKKSWLSNHLRDPKNRLAFEQEGIVVEVMEEISRVMEAKKITERRLAKILHKSQRHITMCFSGEREVSLRELAKWAFVLGRRVKIKLIPLRKY